MSGRVASGYHAPMLCLWLEDRVLRVRDDVPVPALQPGEALVRVRCAGICATDVELLRGYYPYAGVPGHEFVGTVEDVHALDAAWHGARVVGEINASCGACAACGRGHRTHCERRTTLGIRGRHGAFAEYLCLPVANLHRVPDSVSTDAAVFTEPLAAALEIQEQVAIGPGVRVLVVGAGKLGQLVAQTLALTGCSLAVVCRDTGQGADQGARQSAGKAALLAARGIAVIAPGDIEARGFDVAVECTGNAAGFDLARRALRPRGTLVLKSTYAGALTLDASLLVVDEITLVGSRCGPFAPALELLAASRVDVTPLMHARYALRDGPAAFAHAQQPGVLKVLLEP
jgi:threonine dehydrogenase-like Zn-dependent dehydrogenase